MIVCVPGLATPRSSLTPGLLLIGFWRRGHFLRALVGVSFGRRWHWNRIQHELAKQVCDVGRPVPVAFIAGDVVTAAIAVTAFAGDVVIGIRGLVANRLRCVFLGPHPSLPRRFRRRRPYGHRAFRSSHPRHHI